jgi:hypothetical protein
MIQMDQDTREPKFYTTRRQLTGTRPLRAYYLPRLLPVLIYTIT